ncbi:MAG: flippase-like domain-containing protein [Acidimicrobiia bacterium]|nr:flippase-like domain-containing protein [Acidimicrobiia bacterium]
MADFPGTPTTDVADGPGWREALLTALRWIVGLATIAVLVKVGIDQADDLSDVDLSLTPGWLVPGAVLTVGAGLVLPLAWRHLLIAYGWPIPRSRALRAWCLSQATRYLPTGVVAVASRLSLTAAEGVPRSVAAASLALETVLLLGWAALLGAIFIPSSVLPLLLRVVLGAAAAVGLVTLPWTLRLVGRRIPRLDALAPERLQRRQLVEAIGLFGVNTLLRAGRLLALAAALLAITAADVPLVLGASYAGVVAGMIGITPAGIGVREGVITAILADRFGIGDAAALAVLLRAWDFVFELGFLAVATWFGRTGRQTAPT